MISDTGNAGTGGPAFSPVALKAYPATSLQAARRLRGGDMPHVPPHALPLCTQVRLELDAPANAYPELVITDTRRGLAWRVALSPGPGTREDGLGDKDGGEGVGEGMGVKAEAGSGSSWYADILLPSEPTLLRYHFVLQNGRVIRERRQLEGEAEPLYGVWEERDFQLAVYDPASSPPDWIRGAVIYQIFPDRFANGDPSNDRGGGDVYGHEPVYMAWGQRPEHPPRGRDFFGGDLRGVIQKLGYLEELGINVIYFTPIFASPTNHRYDALDYMQIDPRLGTEQDFKELVDEAGRRGIRIILDGVFNHCSSESVYFRSARQSRQSPYYRWFDFVQWPNRWVGWLGTRSRLTSLGVHTMPEFVECPEVEEFFFGEGGVALHWLSYGIGGWRTDVTPWNSVEFWRRMRKAVRRAYPHAYLVAEDWGNATEWFLGDTYDATMNYRFGYSVLGYAGGRLTPAELDDRLETLRRDTPEPNFHVQMNLIGSHDTPRALTRLGGSRERLMLAAALQMAYPGVPMVYYGDEAGVEGEYAEDSRRPYPWGSEDQELLAFYKRAIRARRASPALSVGEVFTVWIDDGGGYGFLRREGHDVVVALFNNGSEPAQAKVPLGEWAPDGQWPDLLDLLPPARVSNGTLHATVPPLGAGWFSARPAS
jgi:glycosidase